MKRIVGNVYNTTRQSVNKELEVIFPDNTWEFLKEAPYVKDEPSETFLFLCRKGSVSIAYPVGDILLQEVEV